MGQVQSGNITRRSAVCRLCKYLIKINCASSHRKLASEIAALWQQCAGLQEAKHKVMDERLCLQKSAAHYQSIKRWQTTPEGTKTQARVRRRRWRKQQGERRGTVFTLRWPWSSHWGASEHVFTWQHEKEGGRVERGSCPHLETASLQMEEDDRVRASFTTTNQNQCDTEDNGISIIEGEIKINPSRASTGAMLWERSSRGSRAGRGDRRRWTSCGPTPWWESEEGRLFVDVNSPPN